MNVIIPIAAHPDLSAEAGYNRSLVEIRRKTVLQHVCEGLSELEGAALIFVLRREDVKRFHFDSIVRLLVPDAKIVIANGDTQGSACSCLLAADEISEDEPLVIAGSDQLVTVSLREVVRSFEENSLDAGVIVFEDIHPRWSYVRLDARERVIEAAEKHPISRNALTGFFYYKKASYFMEAAKDMILKNASVNGQYFVCPTLNQMVLKQQEIGTFRIDKSCYFNFSHPSGVESYEKYLESKGVSVCTPQN